MIKKILKTILISFIAISCTTLNNPTSLKEEIFVKKTNINKDKIQKLELIGNENLSNKEINMYFIDELVIKNNPVLTIDIDFIKAKSDVLVINKKVLGNNLVLDVKSINANLTVNEPIVFMITNKYYDIDVTLNKDIILDNTIFIINKEIVDNYIVYSLKPLFTDEDTFMKKEELELIKKPIISDYKENMILSYKIIDEKEGKVYSNFFTEVVEGGVMKGYAQKNSKIIVRYNGNDRTYTTIADDNNKWEIYIPKGYKGKVELQQEYTDENGNIYVSEIMSRTIGE